MHGTNSVLDIPQADAWISIRVLDRSLRPTGLRPHVVSPLPGHRNADLAYSCLISAAQLSRVLALGRKPDAA